MRVSQPVRDSPFHPILTIQLDGWRQWPSAAAAAASWRGSKGGRAANDLTGGIVLGGAPQIERPAATRFCAAGRSALRGETQTIGAPFWPNEAVEGNVEQFTDTCTRTGLIPVIARTNGRRT